MISSAFGARLASLRRRLPAIGSWQAYLAALGFLAVAALVRAPLPDDVNQHLPPFLTVYPAVLLASFVGGFRIGALTAAAGALMSWALWAAPYGWEIPSYAAITFVVYMLAVGTTVGAAGLARHLLDTCVRFETDRERDARETIHRLKNVIAIVQGIAGRIAAQTPDTETFMSRFSARLQALGAAQNVLVRSDQRASEVQAVVEAALAPFMDSPHLRVTGGPDVRAPAELVSGLSLALYELGTNAAKHGALGDTPGRITVTWRRLGGRCRLEWREVGPIARAGKDGLGSALIRGAMSARPDAAVTYDMTGGEIVCIFEWPDGK